MIKVQPIRQVGIQTVLKLANGSKSLGQSPPTSPQDLTKLVFSTSFERSAVHLEGHSRIVRRYAAGLQATASPRHLEQSHNPRKMISTRCLSLAWSHVTDTLGSWVALNIKYASIGSYSGTFNEVGWGYRRLVTFLESWSSGESMLPLLNNDYTQLKGRNY